MMQKKSQTKIDHIVNAHLNKIEIDSDTAKWLGGLSDKFYGKFVRHHLAKPRAALQRFTIEEWVDSRMKVQKDNPSGSQSKWEQDKEALFAFFDKNKLIEDVSAGDADDYRQFLINMPNKTKPSEKISSYTALNRLGFAKKMFRAAERHKKIAANPFNDVTIKAAAKNSGKDAGLITVEDTEKLLAACNSLDEKLIIALTRFGGFRAPSEVCVLRWAPGIDKHDGYHNLSFVNFKTKQINVCAPKTRNTPGKEHRLILMFAELEDLLKEKFEQSGKNDIYVVNKKHLDGCWIPGTGFSATMMANAVHKIRRHAKLPEWDKVLHNLRGSRQTELEEMLPTHVVCAWLGNTYKVAKASYLKVTAKHIAAVTKSDANSNAVRIHMA